VDGGSANDEGDALVLRSVRSLTLITRIEAYPDLEQKDINALKAAMDQISLTMLRCLRGIVQVRSA
jgi:hypothetical protein